MLYTKQWAYAPIGPTGKQELFDLQKDAYCENNVASDHADVVKELHGKFKEFLGELDAPKEAMAPFK